jgi:enoyl-CoA hydratase
MSFENLLVDRDGAVAVITINRPKVLNALNSQTIRELQRAIDELGHDDGVRAIVITGAGEKAFVAGADINELAALSPAQGKEHGRSGQAVFDQIENLGKPVVAAINGFALGGGCELAMACTLRIAADTARLGQPEINLGIIPGAGGTQLWRERTSAGPQVEAALLGHLVDAWTARRIGLADEIVPAERIVEATLDKALVIASKAPLASRTAKAALRSAGAMNLHAALSHEISLMAGLLGTEDAQEGTRAFLEKRRPNYQGR